jgi:hypothetical protein
MSSRLMTFLSHRLRLLALPLAALLLASCASTGTTSRDPATGITLRFIGESTMPHRAQVNGTTFGGISGIDYDEARNLFYLLADDRSDINAARFYTAKIALSANEIMTPEIVSVVTLKRPDGSTYGGKADGAKDIPDPEAIRYREETDTLLWTSEGDKKLGLDPVVREMKLDGSFIREFATLPMFRMKPGESGPRDNNTFEGMTLTPDGKAFWVSMESALYEDGIEPRLGAEGGPLRITLFHANSGNPIRQIAYIPDAIPRAPMPPDAFADNGVPEILMFDQFRMLVLERSFASGVGTSLRVYLIDTRDGSDVLNVPVLKPGQYTPAAKHLLVNFDNLKLRLLDNTEAMTFGPKLPNGNRTLIFASDDNFNRKQITQFLAFEVIEPKPAVSYVIEPPPIWWPYPYYGYRPWIPRPRPVPLPRPMPKSE